MYKTKCKCDILNCGMGHKNRSGLLSNIHRRNRHSRRRIPHGDDDVDDDGNLGQWDAN